MAGDTPTTTKPGYKTSEFWLAFVAMLLTALYGSGVIGPDDEGSTWAKALAFIAAALTAAGYSVSRGLAKT